MMKANERTMQQRVAKLAEQARDCHRRGDVTLRNQIEETIREIAPRAYAERVIRTMYDAAPDQGE